MIINPNPFPGLNPTTVTTTPLSNNLFKPKKAGKNGVWIYFVLDASGSMSGRVNDTIGGFNGYLATQKQVDGKAWLSALKFESNKISPIRSKEDLVESKDLTTSEYYVGGGTNLLDAVGYALTDINKAMEVMDKADRPTPIIVIITDGEENSSHDWSTSDIKAQMEHCQARGWQATYLGANADAWSTRSTAATLGLSATRAFNYTTKNMDVMYQSVGAATSMVRGLTSSGADIDDKMDLFFAARDNEVK